MGKRFDGLRRLFAARDFKRLLASQAMGGLGEWVATMALITLVWDRTHSAVASGLVLALRLLPAAILSGFLGLVVDRFDRRRVLVACTLGRALIYGSLPLVGGVAPVLALALVAEVGTLAYSAARDATLPRLVPRDLLSTANGISMASTFIAMPFGSGLFAVLLWLQGLTGSRGVDLSLLAAAGLLGGATVLIGRIATDAGIIEQHENSPATGARAGFRAVREVFAADPILRRVALGGLVVASLGGSLLTLGLAYVRETLEAGPAAYGVLLTTFCAGAAAGVGLLHRARSILPRLFHVASGVMGAILLVMAIFPSAVVGYGMSFLFGGAFVATFLGGVTILQDRVHDAVRGRTFAMAHSSLRVGAVVVGMGAAWVAHRLGAGSVFWSMDGTQVVLAVAGLGLFLSGALLMSPRKRALVERAAHAEATA
ncbi:MAG TPA: MFS transporter [Actinomycetota bacterium]